MNARLRTSITTATRVIAPLERAVELLDGVAHGDLTARVDAQGNNEIDRLMALTGEEVGLLFDAIPLDQMREWRSATVERIRGLAPRRAAA